MKARGDIDVSIKINIDLLRVTAEKPFMVELTFRETMLREYALSPTTLLSSHQTTRCPALLLLLSYLKIVIARIIVSRRWDLYESITRGGT